MPGQCLSALEAPDPSRRQGATTTAYSTQYAEEERRPRPKAEEVPYRGGRCGRRRRPEMAPPPRGWSLGRGPQAAGRRCSSLAYHTGYAALLAPRPAARGLPPMCSDIVLASVATGRRDGLPRQMPSHSSASPWSGGPRRIRRHLVQDHFAAQPQRRLHRSRVLGRALHRDAIQAEQQLRGLQQKEEVDALLQAAARFHVDVVLAIERIRRPFRRLDLAQRDAAFRAERFDLPQQRARFGSGTPGARR